MLAVPRLCEFYPGNCLTTEEKARKTLSQGKKNLSQGTVYILPKTPTRYKSYTHTHTHTQTHTTHIHTHTRPHYRYTHTHHTHTHIHTHHTHTNTRPHYRYIYTHTHTHTTHYKMAKQYIIYITLQCNKNIAIEISKGENYEFFWFIVVKCSWTVDEWP